MNVWISFSGLYNSCLAIFQHIESTIKIVNSSRLQGCPNLQAVKVKCPDFNIVAFYWSPNTLLAEDLENVAKGDLISKQFSLWIKSPKMVAKSLPWASFLKVDNAQWSDLAPIFRDLCQSGKLSEIKPPIKLLRITMKTPHIGLEISTYLKRTANMPSLSK